MSELRVMELLRRAGERPQPGDYEALSFWVRRARARAAPVARPSSGPRPAGSASARRVLSARRPTSAARACLAHGGGMHATRAVALASPNWAQVANQMGVWYPKPTLPEPCPGRAQVANQMPFELRDRARMLAATCTRERLRLQLERLQRTDVTTCCVM